MEAKTHSKNEMRNFNFNLNWKKDRIVSISPEASLKEAAQLMKDEGVGNILVMDLGREHDLLGVITDRDIALAFTTTENPAELRVQYAMASSIVTATETDDIFYLIDLMKRSGVTRLPIQDDAGQVLGVVTAKNLIEVLVGAFFDLTQVSERQREREGRWSHASQH